VNGRIETRGRSSEYAVSPPDLCRLPSTSSEFSYFSSAQDDFKLDCKGSCKRDVRRDKLPGVQAGIRVVTCELGTGLVA
jgi:hypothetical protein